MTHPTEMLSALLDGELPDTERARVEAHVAECAACAAHLRELGALDAFARDAAPLVAPPGYHEGLPARLRPRLRDGRAPAVHRSRPWLWPVAAAVALAVITPIVVREQTKTAPVTTAADEAPAPSLDAPRAKVLAPPKPAVPSAPALARRAEPGPQSRAADAFVAPPPAAQEADQPARDAGLVGGIVGGAPAAASAEAPREAAAERKEERARTNSARADVGDARPALKKNVGRPEDARRARDAWRRIAVSDPAGPRADDARVRMIEAGVEAYRLGGDVADRRQAVSDGEAYLARPDATQAERVRAALRRLDDRR